MHSSKVSILCSTFLLTFDIDAMKVLKCNDIETIMTNITNTQFINLMNSNKSDFDIRAYDRNLSAMASRIDESCILTHVLERNSRNLGLRLNFNALLPKQTIRKMIDNVTPGEMEGSTGCTCGATGMSTRTRSARPSPASAT